MGETYSVLLLNNSNSPTATCSLSLDCPPKPFLSQPGALWSYQGLYSSLSPTCQELLGDKGLCVFSLLTAPLQSQLGQLEQLPFRACVLETGDLSCLPGPPLRFWAVRCGSWVGATHLSSTATAFGHLR